MKGDNESKLVTTFTFTSFWLFLNSDKLNLQLIMRLELMP